MESIMKRETENVDIDAEAVLGISSTDVLFWDCQAFDFGLLGLQVHSDILLRSVKGRNQQKNRFVTFGFCNSRDALDVLGGGIKQRWQLMSLELVVILIFFPFK